MSVERKPIVILGPTASGKSDSAMSAAINNGNTEIVVCDAMQVYKRMDIGTAKPTLEDQQKVQHHCIDLVEPSARFTVSDYQIAARAAVADIHSRDKNALVVAGTGLYLTSLIDDLSFPGEWPEIRRELQEEPDGNTLHQNIARPQQTNLHHTVVGVCTRAWCVVAEWFAAAHAHFKRALNASAVASFDVCCCHWVECFQTAVQRVHIWLFLQFAPDFWPLARKR